MFFHWPICTWPRNGYIDEVKGLGVRLGVRFLLRPRFARGYEGQVALSQHLVPHFIATLSRLPLVELLRRPAFITWNDIIPNTKLPR